MNHYEQYQLKRAYRLGYERQLVAARGAAEAKYLHTHERHAQSGVWPTPYSAFETAAWPNTFFPFSRR